MPSKDITLEVLKDIRQELRQTRTDLTEAIGKTNARVESLADHVDHLCGRVDVLSDRVVESEVRVATAVTDLHETVRELTDVLRAQHDLRPRVDRCERDIGAIKKRLHLG